jgi:hypothetical protein
MSAKWPRGMMALAALPCAIFATAAPAAEPMPGDFTFARAKHGVWRLAAITSVNGPDDREPTLSQITCTIATNGVHILLTRSGRGHVDIRGHAGSNDDGRDYGVLNVERLAIGATAYRTKRVEFGHAEDHFSDVRYAIPENERIMTSSFIGYLAVQRRAGAPWLNLDTLLDEMIAAPNMTIGYRVAHDGVANRSHRESTTVSLRGLSEAVTWCARQFQSPEAFRLHAAHLPDPWHDEP